MKARKLWTPSGPALGALLPLLFLVGCGSVHTAPGADLQAALRGGSYTLSVRSDTPDLDPVLYQAAFEELSPLLPIGTEAPVVGEVEVRFSFSQAVSDPTVSYGVGAAVGTWGESGTGGTPPSGGPRAYLNGTLAVVMKNAAGEPVWSADCQYKGRFSLTSTREEVARQSLRKIAGALKKDIQNSGTKPAGRTSP